MRLSRLGIESPNSGCSSSPEVFFFTFWWPTHFSHCKKNNFEKTLSLFSPLTSFCTVAPLVIRPSAPTPAPLLLVDCMCVCV